MPDETRTPFGTIAELWELTLRFEEGTLAPAQWNERTQVALVLWYFHRLEASRARQRILAGLRRLARRPVMAARVMPDVDDPDGFCARTLHRALARAASGDPVSFVNAALRADGRRADGGGPLDEEPREDHGFARRWRCA